MSQYDWDHIERYKQQVIDGDVIMDIWCNDDVVAQATQGGITLTNDEARSVLESVNNNPDACTGINWDVLDCHIDNEVRGRVEQSETDKKHDHNERQGHDRE